MNDPDTIRQLAEIVDELDDCQGTSLPRHITLSPADFVTFWNAINSPPALTPAQRKLGAIMRGEA